MNKFNKNQIERIKKWNWYVEHNIPQINPPFLKGLIKYLAKVMPDYCVFSRVVWYKGNLVVYIPTLCNLNPLFEAILGEKTKFDS